MTTLRILAAVLVFLLVMVLDFTCYSTLLGIPWMIVIAIVSIAAGYELFKLFPRPTAAIYFFALLYLGIPSLSLIAIRHHASNLTGTLALMSLLLGLYALDVAALLIGKLFGRTKLAPRLSPNKTIEGAVGGALACCLVVWFTLVIIGPRLTADSFTAPPLLFVVLYGLTIAVTGIAGDLFESFLKRRAGVKDSGTWVPGGGGILDLIDALMFAAPAAYLFWRSGWLGS